MEHIHLSPEEAIQAHRDVQSEHSFAMHFGTFPLADDGMFDAKEHLRKELQADPVLQKQFYIPIEGRQNIITISERAETSS